MQINFNLFPGGRPKALTMSYDDGVEQDIRLIEIFNKHGIKGAFHINGGMLGKSGGRKRIAREDIAKVYAGHEISLHGYTHQALSVTPNTRIVQEVMQDRIALESITGEPVRGMSYAYGSTNDTVVGLLAGMGVEYCRKTNTTNKFDIPEDFLRWEGTTRHSVRLIELAESFLDNKKSAWKAQLMYVWGHSYEFDDDDNWSVIEEFCEMVGGKDDIWYATNIEIVDYIKAVRGLKFTVDQTAVLNQSMTDVWVMANNKAVKIAAAGVTRLSE